MGGAGFDPDTGFLYVPSRTAPTLYRHKPGDPAQTNLGYLQDRQRGLADSMTLEGLPLFRPPYSRMTAIDLNRAELLWTSPMGNGPYNHPLLKDLALPPLGGLVGTVSVLVTKTLVFGSASQLAEVNEPEWNDADADRQLIFVFHKQNGALLRTIRLDGLSVAAPMTYLHDGTQYIVVAVGSADTAALVALGLPH